MPVRNRLLLALSCILLALALSSLLSPFLAARAIAFWLQYEARRARLTITTSEIRAPFLRPVEIRNLRISRPGTGRAELQIDVSRLQAGLRLAGLFGGSPHVGCPLRWLRLEHTRVLLRGSPQAPAESIDWQTLSALLPEQFDISADEVLLEQAHGRLAVHDAHISGSNGRSGSLAIASVQLRAPRLQRTFSDLHGVTRWQDAQLTIGSLHLLEGLEIDSLAFDFARLRAARIAAELTLTVFNGNVRANLATDRAGKTPLWEGAATASDISLSQLAAAVGWREPVRGSLRASKISFRGDPHNLFHATASIWLELTGFSWRERKADLIMVGANFYERSVQLQEFYIKQRRNELTLSGETTLSADWLNPDFRGDIAGSINDLGQFAELFGASADAFAGTLAIRGRVHAHERKVDGELALTGDALKILHNPVDSLTARFTLDSPRMELDEFEIRRGDDFLRGSGRIDFARKRAWEFSADTWCHDLSEHDVHVPLLGALSGAFFAQADGNGDENTSSIAISAQTTDLKISGRAVLRDQAFRLDPLELTINDVAAAFTGTIDFADRTNVTLTLSPRSQMGLAQNLDSSVCVRGLVLQQSESTTPLPQLIISRNQLALLNPGSTMQTFPLCRNAEPAAQPLRISVPAPVTPPPTPVP